MSVVNELIRAEADGTLSFGNYLLESKTKKQDFEHKGDLYKIKTFKDITKLEKNGMFLYESVPGTTVNKFDMFDQGVEFEVEGKGDAQITIELEDEAEYKVFIDDASAGKMNANVGGKLVLSVELKENDKTVIKIVKSK